MHLVNPSKFDPVVPCKKKYINDKKSESKVNFKDYTYKSNFVLKSKNINNYGESNALFKEIIKDKNNNIRVNEHNLYMPNEKIIVELAKRVI